MNCDELDDKFCVGRSRFAYYRGSCCSCGLSSFFSLLCIEAYEVTISLRELWRGREPHAAIVLGARF